MSAGEIFQWFAFVGFALVAIAGALGMATTMSMFRSGIFLMASFIGVAGLFILLSADLLSLLQIMMYIGGMLVMILFMVLFSHDPGGAMMAWMMELPPVERFFSQGLAPPNHQDDHDSGAPRDESGDKNAGGENADVEEKEEKQHDSDGSAPPDDEPEKNEAGEHEEGKMDMSEMSMTTPLKPYAAAVAALIGLSLMGLLLLRPAWPISAQTPDPRSARQVGSMLMGKYMIAFEGAGLLILIGIFGAVLVSRPGSYPSSGERNLRVVADAPPPPIDAATIKPAVVRYDDTEDVSVVDAHADDPHERRRL